MGFGARQIQRHTQGYLWLAPGSGDRNAVLPGTDRDPQCQERGMQGSFSHGELTLRVFCREMMELTREKASDKIATGSSTIVDD